MALITSLAVTFGLFLSSVFAAPFAWFETEEVPSLATSTSTQDVIEIESFPVSEKESTTSKKNIIALESLNESDTEYRYEPILLLSTKSFLYKTRRGTEGLAFLLLLENGLPIDLNVRVDDPGRAFQSSPNGEYLLITKEQAGFIINTKTLDRRNLIEVSETQQLGVHSDLPHFMPASKWIDDTHVEFGIYDSGASENSSPKRTNIVSVIGEQIMPIKDSLGNETGFAKDSRNLYFWNPVDKSAYGILKPDDTSAGNAYGVEVDFDTFELVGLYGIYSKDKNYAYYSTDSVFTIIKGVDLSTFRAPSTNIWAAEDKNNKYLHGKISE